MSGMTARRMWLVACARSIRSDLVFQDIRGAGDWVRVRIKGPRGEAEPEERRDEMTDDENLVERT